MESFYNKKQTFLIIEPYVYFLVKKSKILLYNTLDGNLFEKNIPPEIIVIFENNYEKYVYLIKNEAILNDPFFIEFIRNLEINNMGFLLHAQTAPIQIPPMLKVISERIRTKDKSQLNDFSLSHLNELSIYLNSSFDFSPKTFNDTYRQLLCNYTSPSNFQEINYKELVEFISPALQDNSLQRINLLGGDILQYSNLYELIQLITDHHKQLNLYLELESAHLKESITNLITIKDTVFALVLKKEFSKTILIDFLNRFPIKKSVKIFPVIENEDDYKIFEHNLKDIDSKEVIYKPFYNGKNLNFFKKYVFFEKDDIFNVKHEQSEIYKKIKLNLFEFGKLILLNDGNIYSNINQKPLGHITKNTIQKIIHNQLSSNSIWFKTRSKEKICRECLYYAFCPSISNYEHVLKQTNLCHINPN